MYYNLFSVNKLCSLPRHWYMVFVLVPGPLFYKERSLRMGQMIIVDSSQSDLDHYDLHLKHIRSFLSYLNAYESGQVSASRPCRYPQHAERFLAPSTQQTDSSSCSLFTLHNLRLTLRNLKSLLQIQKVCTLIQKVVCSLTNFLSKIFFFSVSGQNIVPI